MVLPHSWTPPSPLSPPVLNVSPVKRDANVGLQAHVRHLCSCSSQVGLLKCGSGSSSQMLAGGVQTFVFIFVLHLQCCDACCLLLSELKWFWLCGACGRGPMSSPRDGAASCSNLGVKGRRCLTAASPTHFLGMWPTALTDVRVPRVVGGSAARARQQLSVGKSPS